MDFHSLSRRELQAFCKRNKIPANMTNAAMADALKALEIVEGIEEIMQPSQSESAQSSIELMESSEVTSPFVPPTAGRSTRRRTVLKDDLEAVTSMTGTRRTTRRTAAKVSGESQVDAMETPAVVAQASRRMVQMASACRKMDSQLKECVEEEKKKDALMTPAPLGATSRRRRVEETEKKVYSTRRSVRLAVKNVQMVDDVNSGGSELSNNELFTKDCEDQEVNLKEEGLDDCNEMSGITGVDAVENIDEKSEVVSAQKQDITIGGELELKSTPEEETCTDFAVEVKPDEEICDNTEYLGDEDIVMPANVSDEVQQSEGSVNVPRSENEVTVENTKEVDIQIDAGSQDETGDFESKVDEVSHEAGVCYEVEVQDDVQDLDVTLGKLTELRLQPEELKQTESDEMESLQVEESEKTADQEPNSKAAASKQLSGVGNSLAEPIPTCGADACGLAGLDSQVVVQATTMTGYSDNKENIGSCSELVIMKERMKPAKDSGESVNLHELSMAKLTKMLKEKLEITKKSSKHGNEALLPRPALQALPENIQ